MLGALATGETDAEKMSHLAYPTLKRKQPQLQQALEQLLGDEALRMRLGRAGHEHAAQEFSAAAMTDAYEQAYGIR